MEISSYLKDILEKKEQEFFELLHFESTNFNDRYQKHLLFPFLLNNPYKEEFQNYFQTKYPSMVRDILINGVLEQVFDEKQIVYYRQYNDKKRTPHLCEYLIDEENRKLIVYQELEQEEVCSLLDEYNADSFVIVEWSSKADYVETILPNGKAIVYLPYNMFLSKYLGKDTTPYIVWLENLNAVYEEYVGISTITKLNPRQLSFFRFEQEESLISYINMRYSYREDEQKLIGLGYDPSITYAYVIIDDCNKTNQEFAGLEQDSKKLLFEENLLKKFVDKKLYKYLLGKNEYSQSFLTSEYLKKYYDESDCFDYTAIISGYLKSIEQLLWRIILLHVDTGREIVYGGGNNSNNVTPRYRWARSVRKMDFTTENIICAKSEMGSLWHFLDDNKDLLLVSDQMKNTFINCLKCYTSECRNNSFHKHNINKWSRVELIRRNTIFLYVILLAGIEGKASDYQTRVEMGGKFDDRLEQLNYLIEKKKNRRFRFIYNGEHVNEPNSYEVVFDTDSPNRLTYDNFGFIKSGHLSFHTTDKKRQKIMVFKNNIPSEIIALE